MKALAELIGCSESAFSQAKRSGVLPANLCITIEKAVGRHIMPRELLRPTLFVVEG